MGARIKECRGRRAKPAALVEVVKLDRAYLAILRFRVEETHGHTHPEELGCFQSARNIRLFVHNQVTIVQGLNTEEVQIKICHRIQRRR